MSVTAHSVRGMADSIRPTGHLILPVRLHGNYVVVTASEAGELVQWLRFLKHMDIEGEIVPDPAGLELRFALPQFEDISELIAFLALVWELGDPDRARRVTDIVAAAKVDAVDFR